MHDGIHLEKAGIPAATICTDIFIETSHAMANMWGAPDFPLIFTSHPISHLNRAALHERAEVITDEIERMIMQTDMTDRVAPPS